MLSITAAVLLLTLFIPDSTCDPCYDHQKETYDSQFKPTSCSKTCTVTPFFSPDHSVDAYVSVIDAAEQNIDLLEPDFKSWGTCTHYSAECGGKCIGCTIEDQFNEEFPIFPALVNAVHQKNVSVRFLTNDFAVPTCDGLVTPLDWMDIIGVQIRYYQTTTFMHAKFMIIDKGRKVLISSVNFSKTSFTRNREAGVILSDCSCSATDLYQSVFNSDWAAGYDYKRTGTLSQSDINTIKSPKKLPQGNMGPFVVPGAFVTDITAVKDVSITRGYTAPDNARDTFMQGLDDVKTSLQVHIYQITDTGICDKLMDMHKSGINVTLLVGSYIVSYIDYKEAQECYGKLYDAGMKGHIQKSYTEFSFSHQKYWIADSRIVHLSTGNWSPSDFPEGDTFKPYSQSGHSVNRDMLVSMESSAIVRQFNQVFNEDWAKGTEWIPKK